MNNLLMNKEIAFNKLIGNTYLKRIIEVALTGQHTLTIMGNPENGLKHIKEIFKARDFEDPIFNESLLTFVEPCPCGNFKDPLQECLCSLDNIANYRNFYVFKNAMRSEIIAKLQTPTILDYNSLGESFETVYKRIEYNTVCKRIEYSKDMQEKKLHQQAKNILDATQNRFHLLLCRREKILKVSNTIASMDNSEIIQAHHLSEAVGYYLNATK